MDSLCHLFSSVAVAKCACVCMYSGKTRILLKKEEEIAKLHRITNFTLQNSSFISDCQQGFLPDTHIRE